MPLNVSIGSVTISTGGATSPDLSLSPEEFSVIQDEARSYAINYNYDRYFGPINKWLDRKAAKYFDGIDDRYEDGISACQVRYCDTEYIDISNFYLSVHTSKECENYECSGGFPTLRKRLMEYYKLHNDKPSEDEFK